MKRRICVWVASLAILISLHSTNVLAALYASTADYALYQINPGTGSATAIGFIGGALNPQRMEDIAFSPSGELYGVSDLRTNQLSSINPNTAATTLIGNLGAGLSGVAVALEFSSGGTLYTATTTGQFGTINPFTGVAAFVGNIGFNPAGDLAFAPNGNLYMSAGGIGGNGPSSLVQVNPLTGVGTLVGPIGFSDVFGMDFIGNTLYGLNDSGQLITIDPSTGTGTLVANTSPTVIGLGLAVSPVPEPSSLLLLLSGLGLGRLTARGRARRRQRDDLRA